MTEEPTNRELKIMLDGVKEKFAEKHEDTMTILKEIRADVKTTITKQEYTNGKVAKLIWWRNSFIWALGALWTLILIAFPLLRHVVQLEIEDSVNKSVSASLSQFNIIVK